MSTATLDDLKVFLAGLSLRLHKGIDEMFSKHELRMRFGVAAPYVQEFERGREYLGVMGLCDYVECRLRDEGVLSGLEMGRGRRIDSLAQWDSSIASALSTYEAQLGSV